MYKAVKCIANCILNGIKIKRGYGINNDIYYDYYDVANYLRLIMNHFGMKYKIIEDNIPFLSKECSGSIIVNNEIIGYIEKIREDIINKYENGKLIDSCIYVLELNTDKLMKNKNMIQRTKKYPSIVREYNLLVEDIYNYSDYSENIKKLVIIFIV